MSPRGPKPKDITKQKFERLLAVKQVGRTTWGESVWLFECDCGNFIEVRKGNVTGGYTKSCGCLQKEKARETGKRIKGGATPNWVGDDAKYSAVHKWLARNKPMLELCERCKEKPAIQFSFKGKVGWSRNPDDYECLCRSCHQSKDRGQGAIMTKKKIEEIRGFYAAGTYTQGELAYMFEVDRAVISRIINRKKSYANI